MTPTSLLNRLPIPTYVGNIVREDDMQAHIEDDLVVNRIVDGKLVACRWNDLTEEERFAANQNLFKPNSY